MFAIYSCKDDKVYVCFKEKYQHYPQYFAKHELRNILIQILQISNCLGALWSIERKISSFSNTDQPQKF